MNIIFKKSALPLIREVVHNFRGGRKLWTLAKKMQWRDGLQHQVSSEIMLLQRGAYAGHVWSMCELARCYYYYGGDLFLPEALSWWSKAAKEKDAGALSDLDNLPIYQRILAYCGMDSEYANMEMKCAMLAEWFLTDLGRTSWKTMSLAEKGDRCGRLVAAACPVLRIPTVRVEVVHGLSYHGGSADGMAWWEGVLQLRAEMMTDYERLIEVIFHELGHFVTFAMWNPTPSAAYLKGIFGISDARAESWKTGAVGYEGGVTSEEDPNTLSYGVYTHWAVMFARPNFTKQGEND